MLSHSQRVKKYTEIYALDVIIRDHTLHEYDAFLHHLGETKTLSQLAEEVLARKKQCRVFDVGSGNGQALAALKQLYGKRIHTAAIDLIPATSKLDDFIIGDAYEKDWPLHMDLVVSFRTFHQIGHIAKLLNKVVASLMNGGKAYIWIRVKETNNGKTKYLGEMDVDEENFLQKLSQFSSYGGTKLQCKPFTGGWSDSSAMQSGFALIVEKPL